MSNRILITKKDIEHFVRGLSLQINIVGDSNENFYFTTLNKELLEYCLDTVPTNKIIVGENSITFIDLKSGNLVTLDYKDISYNIFISIPTGQTPGNFLKDDVISNCKYIIDRLKLIRKTQKVSYQRNTDIELKIIDAFRSNAMLGEPVNVNMDTLDLLIVRYDGALAEAFYSKNKKVIDALSQPIANILYHFDKEVQLSVINEVDDYKRRELIKACWNTVLSKKREEYIDLLNKKIENLSEKNTDSRFLKASYKNEIEKISKVNFIEELSVFKNIDDVFFYWPFNNFNLETSTYVLTKDSSASLDSSEDIKIITNDYEDKRIEFYAINDYLLRLIKAINIYVPDNNLSVNSVKKLFETDSLSEEQKDIKLQIFNSKLKYLEERKKEIFKFLDDENDITDSNVLKDITELKELINDSIKSFSENFNNYSILDVITNWPAVLQPAPVNLNF